MDFFDKPTIFRNFAFSESNKCPPQKNPTKVLAQRGNEIKGSKNPHYPTSKNQNIEAPSKKNKRTMNQNIL